MFRFSLLLVLASVLAITAEVNLVSGATEPPAGRPVGFIRGEVTDDSGNPIPDARVHCQRPGLAMKPGATVADHDGRFVIPGLELGSYVVFASKEEAGFPDTLSSFYADRPSEVTLSEAQPAVHVVIQMPPRAGKLIGAIKNARSAAPIAGAQIRLARSRDPNRFIQFASRLGNGIFESLIPAGRGIDISVSAVGYLTWESHLDPVEPGSETKLDISLQPQ